VRRLDLLLLLLGSVLGPIWACNSGGGGDGIDDDGMGLPRAVPISDWPSRADAAVSAPGPGGTTGGATGTAGGTTMGGGGTAGGTTPGATLGGAGGLTGGATTGGGAPGGTVGAGGSLAGSQDAGSVPSFDAGSSDAGVPDGDAGDAGDASDAGDTGVPRPWWR
jgi:hypothetical protein